MKNKIIALAIVLSMTGMMCACGSHETEVSSSTGSASVVHEEEGLPPGLTEYEKYGSIEEQEEVADYSTSEDMFGEAAKDGNAIIGAWHSESVTDDKGNATDLPDNVLYMSFFNNNVFMGEFDGQDIGPFDWNEENGEVVIDSDNPSFKIKKEGEGVISVEYSADGNTYRITLNKTFVDKTNEIKQTDK